MTRKIKQLFSSITGRFSKKTSTEPTDVERTVTKYSKMVKEVIAAAELYESYTMTYKHPRSFVEHFSKWYNQKEFGQYPTWKSYLDNYFG